MRGVFFIENDKSLKMDIYPILNIVILIELTYLTESIDSDEDFNWITIKSILKGEKRNMKRIIKNIKNVLKESKRSRDNMGEIQDREELTDEKTPILCLLKKIITNSDREAGEHIKKIGKSAKLIAESICLDEEKVLEIERMAILHDIGKLGIAREILCKKGVLTEEEYSVIKKHPEIGYEMLEEVNLGEIAENIVLYHHEKWDGSGYPRGKRGNQIPIEARIVALADLYGTLRQKKCYKDSKTHEEAMKLIISEGGLTFDPDLVGIFKIYHEDFKKIYDNNYE